MINSDLNHNNNDEKSWFNLNQIRSSLRNLMTPHYIINKNNQSQKNYRLKQQQKSRKITNVDNVNNNDNNADADDDDDDDVVVLDNDNQPSVNQRLQTTLKLEQPSTSSTSTSTSTSSTSTTTTTTPSSIQQPQQQQQYPLTTFESSSSSSSPLIELNNSRHNSTTPIQLSSSSELVTAIEQPNSNSSFRLRFCKHFFIKMVIIIVLFIIIATILQSFLILTYKCDNSNNKINDDLIQFNFTNNTAIDTNQTESLCANRQIDDNDIDEYPWNDVRLPRFIQPIHYDLYMAPNMKNFFNQGNVTILLKIQHNSTNFLIIHVKKLKITNISITHENDTTLINIKKYKECQKLEQLYIEFDKLLLKNQFYKLSLSFNRFIEDQLEGFYLSSYFNENLKQKRYLLTTHFEPTLARTAFPCFDEPAMKASFQLYMIHDKEYNVYFNTEKISEKHFIDYDEDYIDDKNKNGKWKVLSTFEPTVPMSTYVIAFVICDFTFIPGEIINQNIKTGAIVPIGQEKNVMFALNATRYILSYFENFFKIPYPLKKLDLVAVPDFAAGAMENWGLITFRMTALLYNEQESSSEVKEQVAIVVAHEIAHQWFGNLVTMDWWNDLWLNEGFASFVENLGVDYIHPEWRMLDQFVISTSQHALALDSLFSSHPINTTVINPTDIEGMFDLISYKKGSCLIRMIVDFLGMENLQRGLEKYLNRYKFQTARTSQLWECFSQVSGSSMFNVSAIMDTWIFQQGYPVISVEWNTDGTEILLRQQRFISSLSPDEFQQKLFQSNDELSLLLNQTWIVPITLITTNNDDNKVYWLDSKQKTIRLDRRKNSWFKLNRKQSGFYRVNYDSTIWKQLILMLNNQNNSQILSPSDRAGLIDDALSLMRNGYLDVTIAMNLTKYLEHGEQDYVPWETLLTHFGTIDAIMPQNPRLHRYILSLIMSTIERLGWIEQKTDGMFEKKLRAIILRAAVYYGHRPSIDRALKYFYNWMNNDIAVPANIRDIVYSAGIEHGTDREWNYCWKKYENTTIASEKRLLLGILGATRNHYLLLKYLESSINRLKIRIQDTYFIIQNVARNPIGRDMAWKFIRSNWQQIYDLLGMGSFALDTIISETTWHFSTEFDYEQVETFFTNVPLGSGKLAMKQSLEKIRSNIYWKKFIETKLIHWLQQQQHI